MLYVFFVDTGHMVTFDMNLALGTVAGLKEAIERKTSIPESKQVLLINGGESLSPEARVCSFSAAGTDTSPIFVFNKSSYEMSVPPTPLTDYGPDIDLKDRVESCLDMDSSYNTVVARTELAKQIHEISTQQVIACEKLVHDQHLQHQGWRAVVANLEDSVADLAESWNALGSSFQQFLAEKEEDIELLKNIHHVVVVLKKVPLLQAIQSSGDGSPVETLFDWINRYDHQRDLVQMADLCLQAMDKITNESLSELKDRVDEVSGMSEQQQMKEIQGLEERLSGLELIMAEVKKINSEQQDSSNALLKNQQRASNIRDNSILPDLCRNHKQQLQLMLKNYDLLREKRRTCSIAKKELSNNLHQRLKWIMLVEKRMLDSSERIIMFREKIRRLKLQMDIVRQINKAPQLYVDSVIETIRRRTFAGQFQEWAAMISSDSATIHHNENNGRNIFTPQLNCHFLSTLFPGISDRPPPFALQSPPPFDQSLPRLDKSHLDILRQNVPELVDTSTRDHEDIDHLKIFEKYKLREEGKEESSPKVPESSRTVEVQGSVLSLDGKKFVDQNVLLNVVRSNFNQVEKVKTEINDFKQQVANVKSELSKSHSKVEAEIIGEVTSLVSQFKERILILKNEKDESVSHLEALLESLKTEKKELEEQVKEIEQKMESEKQNMDLEIAQVNEERDKMKAIVLERECEFELEMKKALEAKDERIKSLSHRVTTLQDTVEDMTEAAEAKDAQIESLTADIEELKKQASELKDEHLKELEKLATEFEEEKNKSVKEVRDRLTADHKSEMESLRSRFKLAVSTTTIEKAHEPMAQENLLDERNSLLEQIEELKKNHEEKMNELQKRHQVEIQRLKQVQFNESLNKMMREKDEEIEKLQKRIAERETSSSAPASVPMVSSSSREKVAILKCEVGDLVLLTFAERYNSYIVFSLDPVLHLLHTDSVAGLSGTNPSASVNVSSSGEERRKSWYLVIVTEKEFCQAKKPNNRYNVELGTRFYRIKAIPWNRGQDSNSRMSASVLVPGSSSGVASSATTPLLATPIVEDMSTSCFPNL